MSKPELIPVISSNVDAIGHDGTDMYVRFKNGGLYQYPAVAQDDYQALLKADSVGKALRSLGITGKKVADNPQEPSSETPDVGFNEE